MTLVTEKPKPRQVSSDRTAHSGAGFGTLAARGTLAIGIIMLVGTVIDIGILWLFQRQPVPQWEYVAITSTLEGFPRFLIAIGFFYAAFHFRATVSIVPYRVVASLLIVLGLAAAILGGMMVINYQALSEFAQQPELHLALRSVAIKALTLSALYVAVLLPFGVWALRRPRRPS
jgi:hypothetical protein